ncbi:hypothetical protein DJ021_18160 [Phenylobacterium hankyongense]|uniref:VOC domain-containing protein n=1 Tax=Phenylobacterium hankyongense TaxID=1813876 RepID=A0A328B6V1_9CAUL|nr:VOC family protein [Phenylobacterium hankyongense]RAK61584.1 hypothetical protein DJ021_18160 [Phenylobacterium hankyongense]
MTEATTPVFMPSVFYRDPLAALRWLEAAFGFETTTLVTDAEGRLAYSEMSFHGGVISVGKEWDGPPLAPARTRSPASLNGACTQFIRVHLADGLDAHAGRARAAGATIVQEPADQFYGARVYRALDPEGHVWAFNQEVADVPIADQEAATGLTIRSPAKEMSHG